jgi:hypothetical protein
MIIPNEGSVIVTEPEQDLDSFVAASGNQECSPTGVDELIQKRIGGTAEHPDVDDVPIRFLEKKRLHWAGKTCECHSPRCPWATCNLLPLDLAPLTTVGNLVSAFDDLFDSSLLNSHETE